MNNGFITNELANNNNNVNIPQINGTINLKNSTGNASIKNSIVSFSSAAQSVKSTFPNGTIIGGHISVTNGFLTYNFVVSRPISNTISNVVVDAGNGKELFTSSVNFLVPTEFQEALTRWITNNHDMN